MKTYYHIPHPSFLDGVKLDLKDWSIQQGTGNIFRFLKGSMPKRAQLSEWLSSLDDDPLSAKVKEFIIDGYDSAVPFTYGEAFALEDEAFRAIVFGSINIREMIASLGHERISTDGVHVRQKVFSPSGEFLGWREKDNVYELHRVMGRNLGLSEDFHAVKCWCTTTDNEHWIWVESEYATDALTAIASTFRVHESLIPHIKEIKRQGDILLMEMDEEVKLEGKVVPLTKEQYFSLLTAES